jgi:hypothetical protein
MTIRIKIRRDTAATWATENPILALAEQGLETDTGRMKMGDGTTAWNSLEYYAPNVERNRAGWVATLGTRYDMDNTYEYWWESVAADSDGNVYLTGGDEDSEYTNMTKFDVNGVMQWSKTLDGPDGYEGEGKDVKIASDGHPVFLTTVYNDENSNDREGYNLHKANKDTGAIIGNGIRVKDETDDGSGFGNIIARELAIDSTDAYIVVGSRYGSNINENVTAETGSTSSVIVIAHNTNIPYPREYDDSYIKTQDDATTYYVIEVNQYDGVVPDVTPVTTGTGLVVNVEIVSGTPTATIDNGGTGYTEGRLVKVLGSQVGGVDVTNDLTIYISTVTSGVVTGIGEPSGTSGSDGTYNGVATSVITPTAPSVDLQFRKDTAGTYRKTYSGGTGNVGFSVGDTLTVPGTTFAFGTSPTNDWVTTVTTIGGSGDITDIATPTWNPPTDYIKLGLDSANDFSTGSYKLYLDTNEQAFVHKHSTESSWANTIGNVDNERFYGVTLDSNDNIYAVGEHYNVDYPNGSRWEGLVVKFDTIGEVQWARSYDIDGYEGNTDITNATTDSNDNIYLVQSGGPATVTKIDSDGDIIWQKNIGDGDPISTFNATVEVDSDDNVYFVTEMDSIVNPTDDYLIVKFNSAGSVVWQRSIGTIYEEDASWNNNYSYVSVKGDKIYISGSTEAYAPPKHTWVSRAFVIQLTTDGNWVGETDVWQMSTATWTVSNVGSQQVTTSSYVSTASDITVFTPTFTQTDSGIDTDVDTLHKGDHHTIKGVSRIEFEDGAVIDKYAGRNIPPVDWYDTTYGGDYYLGPREAGRHILLEDDSTTSYFYIPSYDLIDLPIGTVFTIVIINKQNNVYVDWYGGTQPTVHASGQTGSGPNWELASDDNDGTYTIMKVQQNRWIINGPDVVAN